MQVCFGSLGCSAVTTGSSVTLSGSNAGRNRSARFHGSLTYSGTKKSFSVSCSARSSAEACSKSSTASVGGVTFTFKVNAAWLAPGDCKAGPGSCRWSATGTVSDSKGVVIN